MMLRQPSRSERPTKSRYYVTLARGNKIRCLALSPRAVHALAASVPLVVSLGAAGIAALSLRPDSGPQIEQVRQAEMQAAYEDRLAALREQMDLAAQSRARDREALETQMRALAQRQAALDSQAAALSQLARRSTSGYSVALSASSTRAQKRKDPGDALDAIGDLAPIPTAEPRNLPDSVQAFTSHAGERLLTGAPSAPKPRPDGVEIRSDQEKTSELTPRPKSAFRERLASMSADTSRIQSEQLSSIETLAASVARSAATVREALARVGLSPNRLAEGKAIRNPAASVGGPFIPVRLVEKSPFEAKFEDLQSEIAANEKLANALPYLPLGKPLEGPLVTTSPFGVRLDPFLGRLATHPGNDFRASYGEAVFATATGRVASAGYDGGYGNMVEIDHGDGLATRYAHLSEIAVKVGQFVSAGAVVGHVGTTGRSTGPHLHYEVRIDGQPVDPIRFVRAGENLVASR